MNRRLDGIYMRIKRDGKWQAICLSDMTQEELEENLDPERGEWLKGAVIHLALTLHEIGEMFSMALPSTQSKTAQNISDEDLISRKAAEKCIDEALARVFVDSHGCGETALRGLPSVKLERKRGHWVGIDDEPCETWECDQCGCIQECFDGDQPNYCPNCGADMRGGRS